MSTTNPTPGYTQPSIPYPRPTVDTDVADNSITNGKVIDGELAFAKFKNASLVSHALPLAQVVGSTGLVMTATPADAVWATLVSSNVWGLTTNLADAVTKTSTGLIQFTLPDNYIAGGHVSVRLTSALVAVTDTIASNSGTNIDLELYKQSKSLGTVGSDLNGTSAYSTYTALATKYQATFVIDPATLNAGDVVNLKVVGQAIEAGGEGGTLQLVLYTIEVLCDEYGAL